MKKLQSIIKNKDLLFLTQSHEDTEDCLFFLKLNSLCGSVSLCEDFEMFYHYINRTRTPEPLNLHAHQSKLLTAPQSPSVSMGFGI